MWSEPCQCTGWHIPFGLRYSLPGEIQTVPRAEVSAVASLLEFVEKESIVVYIGDNENVINNINKGREFCRGVTTMIFMT